MDLMEAGELIKERPRITRISLRDRLRTEIEEQKRLVEKNEREYQESLDRTDVLQDVIGQRLQVIADCKRDIQLLTELESHVQESGAV